MSEMKNKILILFFIVPIFSCTPKIAEVTYEDEFKKWNAQKGINEVDSAASMSIEYNTYKGLFQGRESFLSFKKNRYSINFNKLDTSYTEKDIKYFSVHGYYINDTSFIPEYCRIKVDHVDEDKIVVDFEIKDSAIKDRLNGRFKLKLSKEFPEHYDVFKYYKN